MDTITLKENNLKHYDYYLTFDIDPTAKGRPRFGKGFVYTPTKTKVYEKSVADMAKIQFNKKPLVGPLKIEVVFYLKKPKSVKRKYPVVKPDLDNLEKGLYDALEGIVYVGDQQIVTHTTSKWYANEGRIEVFIKELV